ncbi:hypothetical protein TPDSL_27920 [Terrisporobacter petrolearius]|uniref:PadR family transcriptional regulator n=1 Tax=Terrisporobacter petrolearius TaxID=1460447 RepID=UPI003366830A
MKENVKGGALTEVTLYILLALYSPNHGYGIMQFVDEKTKGRLVLGAGTLYGAINTLADKKWIELVHEEKKKKDYLITKLGKEIVNKELERLNNVLDLANEIIN